MKTYRFFLVAHRLSRFMPVWLGYWLCSLIGGIAYYFVPEVRRAVRDNMKHVLPDSTEHERRGISRKVIRNQYKNYYDLVRLPHMKREKILKMVPQLEGIENLEEALKLGKGAILLTGHIGNFSLVGQFASLLGFKTAIVAENIEPPQLYNFINKLRGHLGVRFIKMGSAQATTVYRHLREGNVLGLASDRDVGPTGLPVLFFDAVTDLPEGPVVLSMRLGTPIVPAFTWRFSNNKSRAMVYPAIEMQKTGDYEADLKANMRKVAVILEEMILKSPDQWVVLQRVWDKDYTGMNSEPQTTDDDTAKRET